MQWKIRLFYDVISVKTICAKSLALSSNLFELSWRHADIVKKEIAITVLKLLLELWVGLEAICSI